MTFTPSSGDTAEVYNSPLCKHTMTFMMNVFRCRDHFEFSEPIFNNIKCISLATNDKSSWYIKSSIVYRVKLRYTSFAGAIWREMISNSRL